MIVAEAVVATLDGEPLRAAFPMHVRVFGVDAVVIPAEEHRRLVALSATTPRRLKARSPTDLDHEVADFLSARLATMYAPDLIAECERRFGRDRTPSRSSLSRFRARREGRTTIRRRQNGPYLAP